MYVQAVSTNRPPANHRLMGSTETEDDQLWEVEVRAVGAGAVSGFVGGIGMGIVLHVGTDLLPVLGAFAGATSALRGWIAHLVLSMLYGVLFALVVSYPLVQRFLDSVGVYDYLFGGVIYAAMIAAVTIALLPFVLELPWITASAQAPNVPGPDLFALGSAAMFGLGHLVYGAILGVVYAAIGETPD